MFVICVNHSSSCRAANAGVFILNDLLPLNRLPLNKAHAIILSSCLTVSIEGVGGKVEDPLGRRFAAALLPRLFGTNHRSFEEGEAEVTIGRF